MIGAEQAPKDTDGCFKKINIHIFAEGELLFYPVLCFCKLYVEKKKGLNMMLLILQARNTVKLAVG